jgi:U32 family peptidase
MRMYTEDVPELLMPAGDFNKLKYAFAYGADAVYAGVPLFSLRARENGFSNSKLINEAIDYARRIGKRIYLTMNIYAHNSKIERFLDSFCELADLGPDGFIMTDVGLIYKAQKLRPNTTIHLSTQANCSNWTTAEFWRDMGIKRIILSRELSLKEIAKIKEKVPDIELETFVHGSICIAYSGRCLISNYINHRDANQGTCTNSCRWNYALSVEKNSLVNIENEQFSRINHYQQLQDSYYVSESRRQDQKFELDEDEHGTYMMNSKDLCAIELLGELHKAGVCSFKVEGRTKSVYYLAVVTRAYRQAIDDLVCGRPFNADNLKEVVSTANRTLMTGFYLRRPNEYGENFEDGDSLPLTHEFTGQVVDYDPTSMRAKIFVRNKLCVDDTVEWFNPKQNSLQKILHIENLKGKSLESVGGGQHCLIPVEGNPMIPDTFTLLRKCLI